MLRYAIRTGKKETGLTVYSAGVAVLTSGACTNGRGLSMARITFLSRMTVKSGKEAQFERIVKDMQARVHREEKGGFVYYEFFKLREPRRYAVLESFADEAAEHAHMGGKILAELGPGIVECLDGTWEREYLDVIA